MDTNTSGDPGRRPDAEELSGPGTGPGRRRSRRTVGLVAAGLLTGAGVIGTVAAANAGAADQASSSVSAAAGGYSQAPGGPGASGGAVDESKSQRSDEKLLTGATAAKVKAAALAKYPGATILRVETDSDGVYEAHLTTSDGQRVTVEMGKDFAVTGTEAGGPGGHGGQGGHGGRGGPGGQSAEGGQAPQSGQSGYSQQSGPST